MQDFYKNTNTKFTAPFPLENKNILIFDVYDLLETSPIAFLTDYFGYSFTGEKWREGQYDEGHKIGVMTIWDTKRNY